MSHLPRAPRRAAAALLALAVAGVTALQAGTAVAAVPVPSTAPAPETTRAAALRPGGATMGWRQQAAARTRLAVPAATTRKAFVPKGVLGIDVSSWQGTVDWTAQAAAGKRFAYVKATEGTRYKNPYFARSTPGRSRPG